MSGAAEENRSVPLSVFQLNTVSRLSTLLRCRRISYIHS